MSDELPEGWARVKFGTLVIQSQNGCSARTGAGVPTVVLRLADVTTEGRVAADGLRMIGLDAKSRAKYALAVGDLLAFRVNGSASITGQVIHYSGPPGHAYCDHFIRLRPDHRVVDPKYAAMVFREPGVRGEIERQMVSSAGQNTVSQGTLLTAVVPVPPLAEQRRIVARIEELLVEVNRAKARLTKVQAILKRFRQSVLAAACSGELTQGWREAHNQPDMTQIIEGCMQMPAAKVRRGVPETVDRPEALDTYARPAGWAELSVAQALRCGLLIDVKDGNHGANHPKVAEFGHHGLPFITAAQVDWFTIDYDGAYKISGAPLKKLRVGFAQPGDAILTHKGSVGRAALCDRPCVLTPQTTYYRPNAELLDGEYLTCWFASLWFYGQLAAVMSQTTRDFVPISEQYRLFLVLPPLEEQREIARRVRALLTAAATVEARVIATIGRSERLPQAILAKAFSGELVPTEAALARLEGREYEPASVLLKRIIGTVASAPNDKKRSAKRSRASA